MSKERTEELLQKIQSRVNTLIGKSLVMPHLKGANQELVRLGHEIDNLINEYDSPEEREECLCPCDGYTPFCPLHGVHGTSKRDITAFR